MKIYFAVLAHNDEEMFGRLVDSLAPHPVIAHIDAKREIQGFRASLADHRRPAVEFVTDRCRVHWGGFSVVEAMMRCVDALPSEAADNDYVVFLSGNCYPLRPISEFAEAITASGGKVFCRAYDLRSSTQPWDMKRVTRRHWFDLRGTLQGFMPPLAARVLRKIMTTISGSQNIPNNLQPVAGSQWMALPVACAREAVAAIRTPQFRFLRNSFAPDEMAFQTFVHNSRWRLKTTARGPEVTYNGKVSGLQNFHYLRDDMKGHASSNDVISGMQAGHFFIRKISASQVEIIAQIDTSITQDSNS